MQNNGNTEPTPANLLRILVAEDSSDDALMLRLGFERASVRAELNFVRTGDDVLRYLEPFTGPVLPNQTPHPLPDLLLLDLKMPGLDGFEVLQWLRNNMAPERLPVIVFSGSDQPVDINRALALGAARYLVKPQKLSDMVQLVRGIEKFCQRLQGNPAGS